MAEDKLYLNHNLSLVDLSECLKIPPNHISQIINEESGRNFFDFVNAYRVDEAKGLLSDIHGKRFTIASIAVYLAKNMG